MDAELREYLTAMEQRIVQVVQQGDGAIREEMLGRFDQVREEMLGQFDQVNGRLTAEVRGLRAEMAEMGQEVRTLRTDMTQMEQRLIENIQGRREDIDAAFGDINSLKRAVRDLDKRVQAREAR